MKAEDNLRITAICIGGLLVLAGLIVVAVQALLWLHNGIWTPVTVLDAWHYAGYSLDVTGMQWRGLAKLVTWAFRQSVAAALSVGGFCIFLLGSAGT